MVLIVAMVVIMTAAQVYFTFKNYEVNKQHFVNDVQAALDLSIENYYADRARKSIHVMMLDTQDSFSVQSRLISKTTTFHHTLADSAYKIEEAKEGAFEFQYHWSGGDQDSSNLSLDSLVQLGQQLAMKRLIGNQDTINKITRFKRLTQQVMVSISEDKLALDSLFSNVTAELDRKGLPITFQLIQQIEGVRTVVGDLPGNNYLTSNAKSTYLERDDALQIRFENASLIILKRGIVDLLISFVMIGFVVGTVIHLYATIKKQKHLSEIKDDLISNITHEFKTPIATVTSALEGIVHFNADNDPAKTRRYVDVSMGQLKKLNIMVEKLLETSVIDSGKMEVMPEETDLTSLTLKVVKSYQMLQKDKEIKLNLSDTVTWGKVDPFHWENAISNLLDNAIKYGGDKITLNFMEEEGRLTWEVIDNGGHIEARYRDKVFEKLYRIPKGNQHDVKGFGIGLYYVKAIVEKHGGDLSLQVKPNYTCFTITL